MTEVSGPRCCPLWCVGAQCINPLLPAGKATISNDGATILKLLDVVHPAAKTLVDIAKSQDAEVTATPIMRSH